MNYPVYLVCHLLSAVLNVMCNVSVHRCDDFVLPALKCILQEAQEEIGDPGECMDLADGIPGNIKDIMSLLNIEPSIRSLVCCATCFACYSKDDSARSCIHRRAPDLPVCGRPLYTHRKRKGHTVSEPERLLHLQDFKHWLGQFVCRPGMEEILDRDVYATGAEEGELLDIWDGEILRRFSGPDGSRFVSSGPSRTFKLVFAICMDNFNPFFNKAGGKSYSAGVISLICLNLPPGLRHLLENIFVFCVFPGPREPELDDLNNVLCYLMDVFLEFWDPGVYYSSTPKYSDGRLVNAAIVPLIGDLLAAKKMSGIGRWCTQCPLEPGDMDNLDEQTWPRRHTAEEHRRLACEWKSLGSKARRAHFKTHRIRWSELLRLPYWDPVTYTLVEFSHNLLGVNAQHHLRTIFGMNINLQDGLREEEPGPPKKPNDYNPLVMNDAWDKVRGGTDKEAEDLPAYLLKECCRQLQLPSGGRHAAVWGVIKQWVRSPHLLPVYSLANKFKRQDQNLVNEDGTAVNPRPKPKPTDPPSQLEIYRAEATFARTSTKDAMKSVKRNVLEHMVCQRMQKQAQEVDNANTDASSYPRDPSLRPSANSQLKSNISLIPMSSIASSKKSVLIDTLYELVSVLLLLELRGKLTAEYPGKQTRGGGCRGNQAQRRYCGFRIEDAFDYPRRHSEDDVSIMDWASPI